MKSGKKSRFFLHQIIIAVVLVLPVFAVAAVITAKSVLISSNGWKITADIKREILTIEHKNPGLILENVRLNLKRGNRLQPVSNWLLRKKGANQLVVQTLSPKSKWVFETRDDILSVICSSTEGVMTGVAPADKGRIPARITDPDGTPVEWTGTNEVVRDQAGSMTVHQSYLPRQNPEVMYLALGQVSSLNIQCLFERKTDTVIKFPEQTKMLRNSKDENLMDITMPVGASTTIRIIQDYYTKVLGVPAYVPIDNSYFKKAPVCWGSWTGYYHKVTEADIIKTADWIAENLAEYGLEYIMLDDGYDRGEKGEHHWIEKWDRGKFPHGGKWLAEYVKSKGIKLGLWLVPNAYAGAVEEHPEWYLQNSKGDWIIDYKTPSLDCTNPEVLEFLSHLFKTLKSWGFEYYKLDGEYALTKYIPDINRERLYDKTIDSIEAYRKRLEVIREAVGPETFLEGCPAGTPLDGIGYFNSYFNGQDIYNSWIGMHALFSSISANTFLNHIVCYLIAGEGIVVGPKMSFEEAKAKRNTAVLSVAARREYKDEVPAGFGTTMNEARTVISFMALSGATYSCADILNELPEERVQLLKMTLPTMAIVPIDLFSRGSEDWEMLVYGAYHNYPRIMDLKVNAKSGVYDVAAITNWTEETVFQDISFADKLGLSDETSYIVFDYWGQKLEGVFKEGFKIRNGPHNTRVFLIRPLLNRPQVMGTSRHITGAYSILDLGWDAGRNCLKGTSETIAGANYTLSIYVPDGTGVADMRASTKNTEKIEMSSELTGNTLKISFEGQKAPVNWEVSFNRS
jgi:hypothetical protein